jgi:hypothetical protein
LDRREDASVPVCQGEVVTSRLPVDDNRDVRVSMSVLLRVRDDDRYVLFHSPSRPGAYGPPGGVVKYFPPAAGILETVGFTAERPGSPRDGRRQYDLRGFLPASAVRDFLRWFASGAYREHPDECLRRELAEELTDVGLADMTDDLPRLTFAPVRTVTEGPDRVPGKPYAQLRRFEIYDIATADTTTLRFTRRLMDAATDDDHPLVLAAGRQAIEHGREATALIGPQTSFLLGTQRVRPDLPPVA